MVLEGQHQVRATYMGGNMVLIQSPCDGELAERHLDSNLWDSSPCLGGKQFQIGGRKVWGVPGL
ncbi:hypothetical protein A2U01_0065808 [Trifolium medium]|uniref:Uncharacterized protein n=1 Tax=Trifolium medium TaxID=97028 RepID=A0A392S7A2_9FABA|nr:hypothetical protein [Trifolium medium]